MKRWCRAATSPLELDAASFIISGYSYQLYRCYLKVCIIPLSHGNGYTGGIVLFWFEAEKFGFWVWHKFPRPVLSNFEICRGRMTSSNVYTIKQQFWIGFPCNIQDLIRWYLIQYFCKFGTVARRGWKPLNGQTFKRSTVSRVDRITPFTKKKVKPDPSSSCYAQIEAKIANEWGTSLCSAAPPPPRARWRGWTSQCCCGLVTGR